MDSNVVQEQNQPTVLIKIGKFFLFITIFVVGFLLSAIKLPEHFILISDTLPEGNLNFKVQNRLSVIIFFVLLLLLFGKKYIGMFSIAPLKKKGTYLWIIGLLVVALFLQFQPFSFRLLPFTFGEYLQLFFILVIIAPIEEELFYRGLLILIPSTKIKYIMLIISSVLFGLIHAAFWGSFIIGLVLGILAIRYRNILVTIVAHSLWNTFAMFF
ncbi:CAAX amino terminal protease self- immunity [Bacillus sp. THAF10]|uniref:CPBP family intramembrane glutamic endopeptidase n=1 Tax=Bacillus sp. THAF10 TaxID=2587848 RepID=UPI00126976FD|nr:type II CAAX endopeptidase family protein [Bacillus sp. THAF10]QFT87584.1 CAAX amino terminal protease self- immunity [Bacillus sp. THAF10]